MTNVDTHTEMLIDIGKLNPIFKEFIVEYFILNGISVEDPYLAYYLKDLKKWEDSPYKNRKSIKWDY